MPYQGHLVCGIRCNTEEEVRDFYKGLGVTLQNDYEPFEPTEFISFRDTQIDILEKISPHKREELEKIVEKGIGRWEEKGWKISEMYCMPHGDHDSGAEYPSEFIIGCLLTGRYRPELLDFEQSGGAGNGPFKVNYEHLGIALEEIRKKIPNAEIYTVDLHH